jgi:hypothetical protein
MMATLSIQNLVGCTLSSTYDQDSSTQARIAHNHEPAVENYFDNDIFWRAILDMNKIILYADQDGVLQSTQQRTYISIIDGIQAMERSQHHSYGGGGIPYDRHVVMAGVDPVALDAVGCRVMGYDFNVVPSIGNADSDTTHPIGTNDPDSIAVVGDEIDSDINHVFEFNSAWSGDAGALAITDFIPPTIHSTSQQGANVTANISDGLVAYVLYQVDGAEQIQEMSKNGDSYFAIVPDTVTDYRILVQDEHFNTAHGEPYFVSVTVIDNGTSGLSFGLIAPGTVRQPEAISPSITITTAAENNRDVEVYLKAIDFSGSGIITIGNSFYYDSDNSIAALSMSPTYDVSAWKILGPGEILDIYHWLSIPTGTLAGDYLSTFTYKTQAAP